MKKIILFIIAFIFWLSGCSGTSDWNYSLPNNYEVWRINGSEILIKYIGNELNIEGIPSFVKEFSYDNRYVFSRNVDDISKNSILEEKYYALDTKEQKVYGPFESVEDLQKQAKEWQCEIPKKWYRTSPDPNMVQ